MSKTRFIQWIVLACIGTVAACTSSEDGTVGNTELNVIVPTNAGTPNEIDIQTVEYTVDCQGNSDTFLDDAESFPDEVTLNGNLEVVDGQTNTSFDGPATPSGNANPGFGIPRPGDGAEVWQGFMDLPPGPCTVELRARDNDGEVICTAQEPFSIAADVTSKVNLVLICDVSFQAPVGMLDVDATFSFNVGNFCPDLIILNCIDSTPPLPVDGAGDPTGDPAETRCEVRFRDGDSTCGQRCDPQDCQANGDVGLVCTPAPEPRVCPNGITPCTSDGDCPNGTCDLRGPQTVVSCTGGSIDCDGDPNTTETECTYNGDQLGTLFTNIPSMNVPNPATFDVLCNSGSSGATLTCTAVTTDGDEDCNKTKTVNVTCPGNTPCTEYGGDAMCTADAGTVCRADTCNTGTCDGATNGACCDRVDVADGLRCDSENNDLPAECQGGVCTNLACENDGECDDQNDCTETLLCDESRGNCCLTPDDADGCPANEIPGDLTDGDTCNDGNADPTTGGYCLSGACEAVVCRVANETTDCDDTLPCTVDTCDVPPLGGECVHTNLADGEDCTPPAGGICFEINGAGQPSQCLVTECQVPGDCPAGTSCQGTPTCDLNIAGGTCVYPSLPAGDRCFTGVDPATCRSGECGECDGAGACVEKGVTCDPVFRDVVGCQSAELLALDCFLLGSGAPLVLDPQIVPTAAAVAGVPFDVFPQQILNLPPSLVCGFASVVPEATVFNSLANLDLTGSVETQYDLNSFLSGSNGTLSGLPQSSGHGTDACVPGDQVTPGFGGACRADGELGGTGFCCDNGVFDGFFRPVTCTEANEEVDCAGVFFDFIRGCGNQTGSCGAVTAGLCNSTTVECTPGTEVTDCAGTGPGVIVPFFDNAPGAFPPGTAESTLTPTAGAVSITYGFDDLEAYITVALGTLCLGQDAIPAGSPDGTCGFSCFAADRTGDGVTGGDDDSPRIMYDAQCGKIATAACGGTNCNSNTPGDPGACPLILAGQTCDLAFGLCNPIDAANSLTGGSDFCAGPVQGTCTNPPTKACLVDQDCAAPTTALPAGGVCVNAQQGVCVTDAGSPCLLNRECPSPQAGFPRCCEDQPGGQAFFDFSPAANVCATGQPGSALADTQAPCNGQNSNSVYGKACRGATTCGSCVQASGASGVPGVGDWPVVETCSATPGFGERGACANTGNFVKCPNGDTDCRNADGTGIGNLGEDYCVVPCASCDIVSCCDYMTDPTTGRFPTADTTPVLGQFPFVPVNPAP